MAALLEVDVGLSVFLNVNVRLLSPVGVFRDFVVGQVVHQEVSGVVRPSDGQLDVSRVCIMHGIRSGRAVPQYSLYSGLAITTFLPLNRETGDSPSMAWITIVVVVAAATAAATAAVVVVVTIIIIIITIMIMMIAFKGAVRDFWQSPHCAAKCLQYVRSSGQGAIVCKSRATHRALITCNMCAILYEGTTHLLSLTELKSHLF